VVESSGEPAIAPDLKVEIGGGIAFDAAAMGINNQEEQEESGNNERQADTAGTSDGKIPGGLRRQTAGAERIPGGVGGAHGDNHNMGNDSDSSSAVDNGESGEESDQVDTGTLADSSIDSGNAAESQSFLAADGAGGLPDGAIPLTGEAIKQKFRKSRALFRKTEDGKDLVDGPAQPKARSLKKPPEEIKIPENPLKNKDKPFYESEVDAIAKSYQAKVDDELGIYKFGKIVDWGNINVKAIAERLCVLGERMCDIQLFPYQREYALRAFESILLNDGEEITALFSRQSGKSTTIAMVCATCMVLLPILAKHFPQLVQFEKGVMIGVFAPTEEQAKTIGANIHRFLKNEKAQEVMDDTDISMWYSDYTVTNGQISSFVRVQSAAPSTKVESKTYHIIIIDEAQDVSEDKIVRSIHPMAAATSGSIFKIGTPVPTQCEFYEAILRNKRLIYDSGSKVRNHFEFDYKVVIKYNERYKKFIEKEIRRYGTDSDYFRMSYGLEWLLDKGMAITLDKFETAMKDPAGTFEFSGRESHVYVAGLDLAKKYDSTVLTIIRLERKLKSELPKHFNTDEFSESDFYRKHVVNWYEFEGNGWEDQIDAIVNVCYQFPTLLNLAIDGTGVGDPIYEMISRRLQNRDVVVDSVIFSQKSKHALAQTFYSNLKNGNIRIPSHQSARKSKRWEKFYNQMLAAEKQWSGNYMYLTHPDVTGAKDDYVQSLLLALHAADLCLNGGQVAVGPNLLYTKALGEEQDSRADIFEDRTYHPSEVKGLNNFRRLAKEGRIQFNRAGA
jgi:hypothetical protein